MGRRLTRKEMKHDEFVETAVEASHWLEQHWRTVVQIAAVAAVVVVIASGWIWYVRSNREKATRLLAEGMYRYRQAEEAGEDDPDGLQAALALFDQSIQRSAESPAGRSARYYRALVLNQMGRAEEAIPVLDKLSASELPATLSGNVKMLLADVLVAAGQNDRAATVLEETAQASEPVYPPDLALLRLGQLRQDEGDVEEARRIWERITTEYPQSAGAAQARALLGSP